MARLHRGFTVPGTGKGQMVKKWDSQLFVCQSLVFCVPLYFCLSFWFNLLHMKTVFTAFFAVCCLVALSQQVVDVDKSNGVPVNTFFPVNGVPVVNVKYVRLTAGSPFFSDSWMKGVAVSDKGRQYTTARVKLDLIDHELRFLTEKGEEFINTIPLKQLTLTDTINNTAYQFVYSTYVPALINVNRGWYRLLAEGKTSLYQANVKTLQEIKPYNSPVAEQKILTSEEYLVAGNGTVQKVKKPKDLPAFLADKKEELEIFLKSNEMKKGTTAEQMTAMVNYYNSLQ